MWDGIKPKHARRKPFAIVLLKRGKSRTDVNCACAKYMVSYQYHPKIARYSVFTLRENMLFFSK
jgi:hypothetical protein